MNESNKYMWALAIATYNRADVLLRCVELALDQTLPPDEIVIVDGSEDWEETYKRMCELLVRRQNKTPLVYQAAKVRSAAAQRNQCVEAASADVLFLFDDDTLMYPDCAEKILAVYNADPQHQVAGVAAISRRFPPDMQQAVLGDSDIVPEKPPRGRWVNAVRKLLKTHDIFVPYNESIPDPPIPDAVAAMPVGRRHTMAGFSMTVRRPYALKEPFSEFLLDRGPEDSDMSYRLLWHGALLTALDAKVCHVGSPSGRFSQFSRVALGGVGALVLHRYFSDDVERSRRQCRQMLRRRLRIGLAKDVYYRQLSFPRTRGMAFALRHSNRIFSLSQEDCGAWYRRVGQRMLNR